MMNQGGSNTDAVIHQYDPNSLEKHQFADADQGHSSVYSSLTLPPPPPHPPSVTGSKPVPWTMHRTDNNSVENGIFPDSSYHPEQHSEPLSRDIQDGLNSSSHAVASSTLGAANGTQDYSSYTSYSSSNDPYGYGSAGYQGYYYGYQQQVNHSYSPQVGEHQNSGAPYQPLTSFQNSGSYAGSTSYSSTYYNTGDYQAAGGYASSGYGSQTTQTNSWNDGNYANYPSYHYSSYTSTDSNSAHSSSTVASTPNYHEHYKQWADYYAQTAQTAQTASDVTCAPGTENKSITSASTLGIPGVSGGYPISHTQPPPPSTISWGTEPSSSGLLTLQVGPVTGDKHDGYWRRGPPAFQNHHVSHVPSHFQKPLDSNQVTHEISQSLQQTACSQGPSLQFPATHGPQVPSLQYPASHHGPLSYPRLLHTSPSLDTQRVSKLQIPTNPRIASNLALGLPKTDKDGSTGAAAKPSYISILMPKPSTEVSSHTVDSMLKPGEFPISLRAYVERALARCKDDSQKAACQNIMKEMITQASADGTLFTRNWDMEPLFSLPNMDTVNKELQSSNAVSSLTKYKRSPSRRTKSRWEPISEEKLVEKLASVNHLSGKDASWDQVKENDKTVSSGKCESKGDGWSNSKFPQSRQQAPSKNIQRPVKKPRFGGDGFSAAENGDSPSDSDKDKGLTKYYSGAVALAKSPEEKRKRESRFKRFERGHRAEMKHFRPKAAAGNLYTRKASARGLNKKFEDGGSRAVEDIDWDSLTVKGTCQEIEKRYLRLTSAPDPTSVRPEEVLEKALLMVQNSQKNYLYKCDQLKSIRQDLTVQRIRNELTVKVYETHARLALEAGDLPEYNQCESQLTSLYSEGIRGCNMEFSAYNLLCVILHSNNNRDLVASMARLPKEAKKDDAIKHALAVRSAVTSGNYVQFFRLYKTAPNLSTCLMDLSVEKMRFEAVKCMSRSYRPIVPVAFVAQVLGFTSLSQTPEESNEKDMNGLEECQEWLRAHGASLNVDNSGEMQLDTKASSSTIFMPEPEDAVAHGDTNLAVNDFLTRTL